MSSSSSCGTWRVCAQAAEPRAELSACCLEGLPLSGTTAAGFGHATGYARRWARRFTCSKPRPTREREICGAGILPCGGATAAAAAPAHTHMVSSAAAQEQRLCCLAALPRGRKLWLQLCRGQQWQHALSSARSSSTGMGPPPVLPAGSLLHFVYHAPESRALTPRTMHFVSVGPVPVPPPSGCRADGERSGCRWQGGSCTDAHHEHVRVSHAGGRHLPPAAMPQIGDP